MPHTKKYNLIIPRFFSVKTCLQLLHFATYCRMQIIGLGVVVKYTYARGQVTKSEDMPRPDARGRGQGQLVEAEAEDKISASRTVWPRGLNITVPHT